MALVDFDLKDWRLAACSRAMHIRIEKLQRCADDLFCFDDFITRLQQDYRTILNNAALLTSIEQCKLMSQNKVLFIQDLMRAYLLPLPELQSMYRNTFKGQNFLIELHQLRENLIEEYAKTDIYDWWINVKENYEEWPKLAELLYGPEGKLSAKSENMMQKVGCIALITSILTGKGDGLGFDADYDAYQDYKSSLYGDNQAEQSASPWDKIFKEVIDVEKVKAVLPRLLSNKSDIPSWFVVHRILEEIEWLEDEMDVHFINWVDDVYGWSANTKNFKHIQPAFKNTHSLDWDAKTITSAKIALDYKAQADTIRNEFVVMDGRTVKSDNTYYFKKPDLYIAHKKKS